nr:MAG TPA: hypothetical protein [Caudoviricetes sp.]
MSRYRLWRQCSLSLGLEFISITPLGLKNLSITPL